ncbi:unnamed protein product, partial [Meganyctiphanes norvegica]
MYSSESIGDLGSLYDGTNDHLPIGMTHTGITGDANLHRSLATYRYENAMVKTELAATLERNTRELQELKLKGEIELRKIQEQNSEVWERLTSERDHAVNNNRKIQQINLQLQQKLKLGEEDLLELQTKYEVLQHEKEQRVEENRQKTASLEATIQNLKREKTLLEERVDQLQGDLSKEKMTNRELATTLSSEKHQQQLIKSRLGEVEQQCRLQLSSAQGEIVRLKEERDKNMKNTSNQLKEMSQSVEEQSNSLIRTKERAAARELELQKSLATQRQAQLAQSQQLIQQNNKLQERIKIQENQIQDNSSALDSKVSFLEQKLAAATEKLHQEEREKAILQGRLDELCLLENKLRREVDSSSEISQELLQLKGEHQEFKDYNEQLKTQIEQLTDRLKHSTSEVEKERENLQEQRKALDNKISDQKSFHQEEITELRARVSELQSRLNDRSKKYLDECSSLSQSLISGGTKKLKDVPLVVGLLVKQFEARQASLREIIPPQMYRQLQQQLDDMTRKHNEFAAFISGVNEFQSSMPEIMKLTSQAEAVGQRLSELDESQIHCLSDLESL